LAPGSIITALSDGNQLIILSQSSAVYFYGADGSASLPTFSFLNDTSTGMYLDAVGSLGLTTNGFNILTLDGTIPSAPLISTTADITTNATITAEGGISGGTF
jgi:hypothetical protein